MDRDLFEMTIYFKHSHAIFPKNWKHQSFLVSPLFPSFAQNKNNLVYIYKKYFSFITTFIKYHE